MMHMHPSGGCFDYIGEKGGALDYFVDYTVWYWLREHVNMHGASCVA
jgi:hypothetical protein